ncbi:hypothetical protein N7539_006246 [Penicillium diatomitis]|uniref:Uncharacterized protein n=1 Tax=Penicillium diatomitis TaxID=2819901 RepID=A0A9X0BT19_9EURO|nr:uncharacterized protein N7539_006246 [Penicillium diatomitis]KAJ5482800.1 hypothetical protein N7539_006246 [Penicillium diatomitis]
MSPSKNINICPWEYLHMLESAKSFTFVDLRFFALGVETRDDNASSVISHDVYVDGGLVEGIEPTIYIHPTHLHSTHTESAQLPFVKSRLLCRVFQQIKGTTYG